MAVALDLDGVVWRGPEPIAGSAAAVRQLQDAGHHVCYVTNNATLTTDEYVEKLESVGIRASNGDVIHAGHAVARLMEPGSRVLVCAGMGVTEALVERGVLAITAEEVDGLSAPEVDAVAVGWGALDTGYRRLTLATRAVLGGARLLAPSPDPLYPTVDGVLIGGGALASAVSYATKTAVEAAGKPAQSMVDALLSRVDTVELMVGDQLETDGLLGQKLGVPFALVRSGVTDVAPASDVPVAIEGADLAEVVDRWLSTTAT